MDHSVSSVGSRLCEVGSMARAREPASEPDAGVTRPTLYRRWKNKLDLVVDALDYGFRKQGDMYTVDLSQLDAREALVEAVHRVNPTYYNPDAMVLMGNFAGEAIRTPELLDILRRHAVEP